MKNIPIVCILFAFFVVESTRAQSVSSVDSSGNVTARTFISNVTTGTAPLAVSSTTNVANLNASSIGGSTFAAPGAIGSTTPSSATFTGITFSPTTGGIQGTSTSDSASSGIVGEYVSSTVTSTSAVSLTTNTSANVTSISLTPGDWLIGGIIIFHPAAGVATTYFNEAWSTVSAGLPGMDTMQQSQQDIAITSAGGDDGFPIPTDRVSIASTTTYYLTTSTGFSGGSLSAYGKLWARRLR